MAVEVDVTEQAELQRDYEAFLASSFDLPPDEEYQLGFRLAKAAGLRSVSAVNAIIGSEIDPWSYAKEHGQTEVLDRMTRGWQAMLAPQEKLLANGTVGEVLALMNTPERRRREHELYLELAAVGDDSQHAGADWLAGWYQRNLVIYSNLRTISVDGDRLLVIYGAGHIPWLRTLYEWTPGCVLEEPIDI